MGERAVVMEMGGASGESEKETRRRVRVNGSVEREGGEKNDCEDK